MCKKNYVYLHIEIIYTNKIKKHIKQQIMNRKYIFEGTLLRKRAMITLCLLGLATSAAWAQTNVLTVTGTQVPPTKVYDGTTSTTVTVGTVSGVADGHIVFVYGNGQYLTKTAGTNKDVVVTYSIGGPDAAYYTAPANDTLTADITPKQLMISGTVVDSNKIYTRGNYLGIQLVGTLIGVVDTDLVFPQATAHFLDVNVGMDKPVQVDYLLYGTNANNYLAPLPDTLTSTILPKPLDATGVVLELNKEYDGTTYCRVIDPGYVSGVIDNDTVMHALTANYVTPTPNIMAVISVNHVLTGPQSYNYVVVDTNLYVGSILKRHVTIEDYQIQAVKEYDGTDNAIVLSEGTLGNVLLNEEVTHTLTANYNDAELGHNKTITVHVTLDGADKANYSAPSDIVFTTEGKIIEPTELAVIGEDGEYVMPVNANGFCEGSKGAIRFHVQKGEPTMYRLLFNDEAQAAGFDNTGWIWLTSDTVEFMIPTNCPEGNYAVSLVLMNEAMVQTNPYTTTFKMSMSNHYLVQVFDDVVSIDNSGRTDGIPNRFTAFQWYRDGNKLDNATKPYYQEKGGLNGSYSVYVTLNTEENAWVCPITLHSVPTSTKQVHVYPNPVMNNTTVRLEGFEDGEHVMTIHNSYGVELFRLTFNGIEKTLDMSNMPQGQYMISVDGVAAKAMKM